MIAVQRQIGFLLLLVSLAGAQSTRGPASVQDVKITRDGRDVRVDITLSAPVTASVSTALHPDRLVLELPNTTSSARQQRILVNFSGVRAVRYGLHSAEPASTHLVVELDQALAHSVSSNGSHVILKISAPDLSATDHHGAPAAAASAGLIGVFRRRSDTVPPPPTTDDAQLPAAPPSGPPIRFPEGPSGNGSGSSTASASSTPSAAHPNRGSLQEGTVFPSMGAPGTGSVPGVVDAKTGGFNSGTANGTSQKSATAQSGTALPGTGTAAPQVSVVPSPPAKAASQMPAANVPQPTAVTQPTVAVTATKPPSNEASDNHQLPSKDMSLPQGSSRSVAGSPTGSSIAAGLPSPTASSASAPPAVENQTLKVDPAIAAIPPIPDKTVPDNTPSELDLQLQALRTANPNLRTVFKVKYVAEGVAYLDGGRSDGLTEGMKLEIKDSDFAPRAGESVNPADPRVVAELEVNAIADTSSVTDIHTPKRAVKPGDLAYLSSADLQAMVQQHALSTTRKYPAVVTFTEGDPLEEEARAEVPKPPLPSVNRARGRIGFDYIGTSSSGVTTSNLGMVLRADITRLNGTYWNVSGYWRGRLQSTAPAGQQTIQDLINRTYHLSMTYDNPNSNWVAGFGRLYLPWAPSLETIDGGYFGRRMTKGVTAGFFAGSTPDPSSYTYNPDQEMGGAFINFDGGSYDNWKYTSTSGLGINALKFAINRPFVFFENGIFYKRYFSIYDSLQADSPKGNAAVSAPGPGLSRNFLTIRIQPHPRLELDFNHNYFRDVPTFDPALIGTGLLDKYLFQGVSVGARVEVAKQVFVYSQLGTSNRTGDAKTSLNQTYGLTFNRLPWFGLRADGHYSRFNSSFGDGSYKSFSLSRNMNENLRLEVLMGEQNFTSLLATSGRSRFFNSTLETTLGPHYFMQGGFTVNHGELNYTQWMFTMGYRFDSKAKHQ